MINLGSFIQDFLLNISKENFINEQKNLIFAVESNTVILFAMTFMVLYSISSKINLTDKDNKPDNLKILLISVIVSLLYFAILSIRILTNIKLIL